jgi:hypothetical protein
MATNIYTGRNLTLTIATISYSAQISSVTLTPTQESNQYITLTGSAAKQGAVTWSLDVEGFQDWLTPVSPGFSMALYTAAATGTAIAFSFTIAAGTTKTVAGSIVPVFSQIGGAATEALTQTYSFLVTGDISLT